MEIFKWLSIILFSFSIACLSKAKADPKVRVRLLSQQDSVVISGTGIRVTGVNHFFKHVSIPMNETVKIQRIEKQGRFFWKIKSSRFETEKIVSPQYLLVEGRSLKNKLNPLPDQILLTPTGVVKNQKQMDLIGVLPLEEYIVGVLTSEMPPQWPMETLKAQAIAARSFTLAIMRERSNKPYHLENSILDQVFNHVLSTNEKYAKAFKAVKSTEGLHLAVKKGQSLKAFYHSDCGGKTELAKNVWKAGDNSGVAVDNSCPNNPNANWSTKIRKGLLYSKISNFLKIQKKNQQEEIIKLEFITHKVGDRVQDIKVHLKNESVRYLHGNDFRALIGYQEMKSLLFQVNEVSEYFLFQGKGYGHGVGLCQWGSRTMGLSGNSFQEILKHYYPLAQIEGATIKN